MPTISHGLPSPWRTDPGWLDLPGLAAEVAADDPGDVPRRLFLDILREAAAIAGAVTHPPGDHGRACRAQTVLSLATGAVDPAPERWAVAWLESLRRPYLRQWWRHAAADPRLINVIHLPEPVTALSGDGPALIVGLRDGGLLRCQLNGPRLAVSTPIGRLDGQVWSIATAGRTVVAGGAGGHLAVIRDGQAALYDLPLSAVTAVATDGTRLACGFEEGRVWMDGGLLRWEGEAVRPSPVLAMMFDAAGVLHCLLGDGTMADSHGGPLVRRNAGTFRPPLRVGAWHPSGGRAAVGTAAGEVLLVEADGTVLDRAWWRHTAVSALTWSAHGTAASAGYDRRIWTGDGQDPHSLRSGGPVAALAFAGDLLVSGINRQLTVWQPSPRGRGGRAVGAPNVVVALGLDPARPDRIVSAAKPGLLRQHERRGRVSHDPVNAPGLVRRIAGTGRGWLVAASGGLLRWTPGQAPHRIDPRGSQAVATSADGQWFAGCGETLRRGESLSDDGAPWFAHDSTITDVATSPGGDVASLDDLGMLRVNGKLAASLPPASRLIRADAAGALLFLDLSGTVYRYDGGGATPLWSAGGRVAHVATLDGDRVAVAREGANTVEVVSAESGEPIAVLHAWITALAACGSRLAVASGGEVALYDLVDPASRPAADDLVVHVRPRPVRDGREWLVHEIRFPDGAVHALPPDLMEDVVSEAAAAKPDPSGHLLAMRAAERVGGWLEAAGLRLAVDQAVGRNSPLPARTRLVVDSPLLQAFPWELAFDPGQLRTVRSGPARPVPRRSGTGRLRLVALLADHPDFGNFARTYPSILDRFPRFLELDAEDQAVVRAERELPAALRPGSDAILLLAHAATDRVVLSPGQSVPVDRMAELLANAAPRLAVLGACDSLNLAHELAMRGVEAVVGMRTKAKVYALEQLLEELIVNLMVGMPVEAAYARALDACVRLPTAGIPVLYLHPDAPDPFVLTARRGDR